MRSASLVGAARVRPRRLAAESGAGVANRAVVESVLQRADEPGELLAYWTGTHGRRVPKPVKRGIADAVAAALQRARRAQVRQRRTRLRMADVLDLAHPLAGRRLAGRPVPVRAGPPPATTSVAVPAALRVIAAQRGADGVAGRAAARVVPAHRRGGRAAAGRDDVGVGVRLAAGADDEGRCGRR